LDAGVDAALEELLGEESEPAFDLGFPGFGSVLGLRISVGWSPPNPEAGPISMPPSGSRPSST
jgi:hypothetical protein